MRLSNIFPIVMFVFFTRTRYAIDYSTIKGTHDPNKVGMLKCVEAYVRVADPVEGRNWGEWYLMQLDSLLYFSKLMLLLGGKSTACNFGQACRRSNCIGEQRYDLCGLATILFSSLSNSTTSLCEPRQFVNNTCLRQERND